jgi:hypothetical protein
MAFAASAPKALSVDDLQRAARAHPRQLAIRIGIAALAVLVCHLLPWHWLRYATSEGNIRLDKLAGISLQRVSFDLVMWHGALYRYEVACTFADVWCGAIPLLWNTRISVARNLRALLLFSVALFLLNVLRLSISDVLYGWGVPWVWAHEAFGGVAYLVVWAYIWTRAEWRAPWRPPKRQDAPGQIPVLPVSR